MRPNLIIAILAVVVVFSCLIDVVSEATRERSVESGNRYNAEYIANIKWRVCTDAEMGLTEELRRWAAGEAEARDPCYRPTPFMRGTNPIACGRPIPLNPAYCPFPK